MWMAVEAAPRVEPAASRAPISIDDLPSGPLDEAQAQSLFARFGAPSTREVIVASAAEAARAARELGGRVALKILSAKIAHKSDVGGVAIGLDADSIGARLERMRADVSGKTGEAPARFLVQEMVSGVEMILGCQRDALGVAILVGMGGVNAEVLRDTVLRMPCGDGLSREEARSMVRALRSFPLLDGYRGRPKADIEALIDAIVAFSAMCARLGDRLLEAEINPLFVGAEGEGARAADAVATLK
jgi:succinyl-CoA synthetase beta subunit